jgi:hypothetical protein
MESASLQTALPPRAWAIAALCVALMILFRPVYNLIKRLLRQA